MPQLAGIWYFERSLTAPLARPLRRRYVLRALHRPSRGKPTILPSSGAARIVCLADLARDDQATLRRLARREPRPRLIGISRDGADGEHAAGCFATLPRKSASALVRKTVAAAFDNIELAQRGRAAHAELKRAEREMSLTRFCGKQYLTRVIVIVLMAAFPVFAGAQEAHKVQPGAPRTIVLPQKMVAGAPATLAVLDAAGRMLPKVVVELPGGQKVTTDATGRALFTAPSEPGILTAQIPGQGITASAPVVQSPDPELRTSAGIPPTAVRMLAYPHFISLHDRFTMEGAGFRSEAEANRVFLADQACLVLASSPVSLVVLPGLHIPVGAINLRVNVAGHDAGPNPVVMVLLEFSGPAEAPNAGAQGRLSVRVHGTGERLAVEVRNGSPEIIQFPRGNLERVTTSGGERNAAEIETKFLATGDYTVTARLIPTDSGLPDLEAARQKLVAARALATGSWAARADRLIRRIDRAPQDIAQIRTELERMLNDKPSGQFAFLLESAWQEFQKNN
jgi:hypothetical protein